MKRNLSKIVTCIVLAALALNMTVFAQYYKNDLTGIAVNISDGWVYEDSDENCVSYTYKYDDNEFFGLYFDNGNYAVSSAHEITDDDMYNICMDDMSDDALAKRLSDINGVNVAVKNESTVIDRIYIGGRPFISLSKSYTATASGYYPLYGFSAAYVCIENSKMVVLVYNRTKETNHFSDVYEMLSGISIPQSASATVTPVYDATFDDVTSYDSYYTAVETLNKMGIISGDDNNGDGVPSFRPNSSITRGEMAVIICRMQNDFEAAEQANTVFIDVPKTHWASGYVAKATNEGIVCGYGNGLFGPDDPVLYEEAVKMIVEALGYEQFARQNGGYPAGYFAAAQQINMFNNVIGGAEGRAATRAQVAQMVYNAINS